MERVVTQEAIAERVAPVRWHGGYFSMRCPFHDDREPSLLVYKDGAFCMGCRRAYSLKDLVFKLDRRTTYKNIEPQDGRKTLKWRRLPPPNEWAEEAHSLLTDYPNMGGYLKQRGIDSRIEINRIGWWEGYFTFPGYDIDYEYVGLVVRASPEVHVATKERYLTPPHQEPFLYVPDWNRIAREDYVFVTFGIFDALYLATLGFPVCSPSNGQTADGTLFDDIRKRLIIIPDDKDEEVETAHRLIASLGWRGEYLKLPYTNELTDPADFIKAPQILISHLARV